MVASGGSITPAIAGTEATKAAALSEVRSLRVVISTIGQATAIVTNFVG